MIRITNLYKSFGAHKVLNGLNLHVERGEIYGFIGANGAGKTTTMNILMGLTRFDEGKCRISGNPVNAASRTVPRKVGYLPESPGLYPYLTGREYLQMLYRLGQTRKSDKTRINAMLHSAGLEKAANRRIGKYSRGMKQRMGMAAILLNDPELLILDEPSSALDPEGRRAMQELILSLNREGKTVFLSTHILDDIERICTRIGFLHEGRIVLDKSMQDLEKEYLQSVYDVQLCQAMDQKQYTALSRASERFNGLSLHETVNEKVPSVINTLSFVLDHPDDTVPILKLLADSELAVKSIRQRTKSLEEIILEIGNGQ